MNVFITLDVSKELNSVIDYLQNSYSYHRSWQNSATGKKNYLPSNCLWKPNCPSVTDAKKEILLAINRLNIVMREQGRSVNQLINQEDIKLLRLICLPAVPWDGIEGEPIKD